MLKTLGAQVREYKRAALITPVFMIFEAFFETVTPLLMSMLVDNGVNVPGGNLGYIVRMGLLMLFMAVLGLASGIVAGIFAAKASTGFAKNTSADAAARYLRFAPEAARRPSGL